MKFAEKIAGEIFDDVLRREPGCGLLIGRITSDGKMQSVGLGDVDLMFAVSATFMAEQIRAGEDRGELIMDFIATIDKVLESEEL